MRAPLPPVASQSDLRHVDINMNQGDRHVISAGRDIHLFTFRVRLTQRTVTLLYWYLCACIGTVSFSTYILNFLELINGVCAHVCTAKKSKCVSRIPLTFGSDYGIWASHA
jgi:hypothetical protein